MITLKHSVNSRVVVLAGLVLAAFLSAAGWVLDQAFRDSASIAVRERLTSSIFLLLGSIEVSNSDEVSVADDIPKPEWQVPESGHFAQIFDASASSVWHSRSMLGLDIRAPGTSKPGEFFFAQDFSSTGEPLFILSYTVMWETSSDSQPLRLIIQTAENEAGFREQLRRFRRSLWGWFFAISVGFLFVQTVILRWGLKPLRDLAHEVAEIEFGNQRELSGEYPVELRALGDNLNALIRTNLSNVQRYRNALGDLAHSLKTPLAVIKSALDGKSSDEWNRDTIGEQVEQLDKTINYQLQRAAAAGRPGLARSIDLDSIANKIAASLRKVYATKGLELATSSDGRAKISGDEGDLMEIIGNVADNACKWATKRVEISTGEVSRNAVKQLRIAIEDDGPGMPPELIGHVLKRGARLDQTTEGQGIGLAVVRELVEEVYDGELQISSSPAGTTVSIYLPI
ncbi:MAG: ATP-binding protein [Gammaproteobacteria bacterium]